MTYINQIRTQMADTGSIDAFARARVSEASSLFDGKLISPAGQSKWDDQETSGGGTSSVWDEDAATLDLSVSNLTVGTRVRQTYSRFNYQPGKSQMVLMTGVMGAPETGITKRWGYFEANNGIMLECAPAGVRVGIRNQTVDTMVDQTAWNIDKMDGTGPSKVTINWNKAQILLIDMEWLGVGRVRIGFVVDGIPHYVHHFHHSNIVTSTYMGSPNLPLRYEITNDGTGGASDLKVICSNVSSEGGQNAVGSPHGYSGPSATGVATGTNAVIAAIRTQTGYEDAVLRLSSVGALGKSNNDIFTLSMCKNPTFVAGAQTWSAINGSAFEVLTSVHTVSDLGDVLTAVPVYTKATELFAADTDFSPGVAIDGTRDVLVIVGTAITNGIDMYGSLNWFEFG